MAKSQKNGFSCNFGNTTRLPKVTSMNFCSAAKPISQRSRSGFTLSGKARGAVGKRQGGGQKGATGLLATASNTTALFKVIRTKKSVGYRHSRLF